MCAVRGRPCWGPCPAPFSCSDGDMISLPPVDQSLVVLGCAQCCGLKGSSYCTILQTADITEETLSGSAFPQGNIIIAVVVKREMWALGWVLAKAVTTSLIMWEVCRCRLWMHACICERLKKGLWKQIIQYNQCHRKYGKTVEFMQKYWSLDHRHGHNVNNFLSLT